MEEPTEIVKRIPNPNNEAEDKIEEINHNSNHSPIEYTHPYQEEEKSSKKKSLLPLFGIATVGIIGYLGFNSLQQESINQTPKNSIVTELNSTQTERNDTKVEVKATNIPKEETNYYVEALSIPKNPIESEQTIEPTIISTPPIIKEEKKPIIKVIETVEAQSIEKKEIEIVQTIKEEVKPKEIIKFVEQKIKKEQPSILKYEKIKPRIVKVRVGDTLASISERFYGNPMEFKRIIRANSQLRSEKTALRLGDRIIIPRKDRKKTRRFVIVKKGNTLASISRKVYGSIDKISKIVRANYKIKSKNSMLQLGQKVYVPR
jgi:nucleoid-associated protein YgaU